MKKRLNGRETLLIATMLFGMFFGAGNLIFPVYMGQLAGRNIWKAIAGFIITGVSMPLLGVAAIGVSRSNGLFELSSKVSRPYGYFFTCALYLSIGPFFAIPRCATVPFTVAVSGLLPAEEQGLALAVFSLIFFALVLGFSLNPGKILTYVGKVLTPVFLVFLAILVVMALVNPVVDVAAVEPQGNYVAKSFFTGFLEGYNTMDMLASLAFGIVVINVLRSLGVNEPQDIARSTAKAGFFSCLIMAVIYVFVTLVSLSAIVPLLYVLLTSLKTSGQIYDVNQIVPTSFTLENYINVLYKAKFLTYFRNSVIVAVCTTVVCMVLSICAGYGMTRYRVRGSQKLKMGILYTRMFPSVLLALPYYVIMRNLDLGDSLLGLILIYCSFTLPFTIWNMQTFFRQLPWELEEAACIDGASRTTALFRVILPMARPGIIATGLFSFMTCWDEYMYANLFISSTSKKTISLGIQSFIGEYSTDWGSLMAATVIAMVPIIIFFVVAQKNLVGGLSAGAVKG